MPLPPEAFDHPELQVLWAMAQETRAVFFNDVKAAAEAVGESVETVMEWLHDEGVTVLGDPDTAADEEGATDEERDDAAWDGWDEPADTEPVEDGEKESIPSSLQVLFQSLRWKRALSVHEESALIRRVRAGDMEAREQLIEGNLRLVVSVAMEFAKRSLIPLEDLVQEGCLGLIRAVDRYDWRKGMRFSSYAVWWIRQYIVRAIAEQSRLIHVPFHLVESLAQVMAATQRLTQELGRAPTTAELAEATGLTPEKVDELLALTPTHMSLDTPIDDEEQLVLEDTIPDPNMASPEDAYWRAYARERLRAFLEAHLTEREWQVLQLRFGLTGDRTYTLDEIGRMLKITGEAVRQIERRALEKLRHPRYRRMLERLAELMA
jgi:RNA polymerase primary sigma factor